jgi:hypothetical protein
VAGTQGGNAIASEALCGTASIVMSLLQQIPEKYHDHNDAHKKLAQLECTARKESKSIGEL